MAMFSLKAFGMLMATVRQMRVLQLPIGDLHKSSAVLIPPRKGLLLFREQRYRHCLPHLLYSRSHHQSKLARPLLSMHAFTIQFSSVFSSIDFHPFVSGELFLLHRIIQYYGHQVVAA